MCKKEKSNLRNKEKMKYEIEFAESENGEKPFEDFVLKLPIKERAVIFETINYFLELKNMTQF